jgi:CDP-6-deoxy-D-xylo-4-hexulose-3-dehydrase
MKVTLAEDTISQVELNNLCQWIQAGNRLTKGEQTLAFEEKFKNYMGTKYAIYTNSGSSANLMMIYALKQGGYLRNNKVIAPAVSWVTTVSPLMQFGFDVSLCECDANDLGFDIDHFEQLCATQKPALAILVHVLGHANQMKRIQEICDAYDVILLEDSCEALGSEINGQKLGALSKAGSFSFYYGHHISTIEGGMVVTNDDDLYHIMVSIRSHGWSRDLPEHIRQNLTTTHEIDSFRNLYTFYYPGFNLRSTDLQAFIGIGQIDKLENITKIRQENFKIYQSLLPDFFAQSSVTDICSSFAYGTFVKNRLEIADYLKQHNIETRPLICGNIARHPFWIKENGVIPALKNADKVHDYGLYLPNHHNMGHAEIEYVCEKFNEIAIKF